MLAGAACVALMIPFVPAHAAAPATQSYAAPVAQAVADFYAARRNAPLWLREGQDSAAVRAFIPVLQRAPLDGFSSGPMLASQVQALLGRAAAGDEAALAGADRLMSTAWVMYVQALQRPPTGMIYADSWVVPRRQSPAQILAGAAQASSLAAHVRAVSSVNPIYARLREAAWSAMQQDGGQLDPRVATSLDRVRDMPFQKRYIIVDAASARLFMIEDGQIAGSMKVVVGKPSAQTPMLASTIYYATLNPYWHVSGDMVRSLIARNVLDQGFGYLKSHGYQVFTSYGEDAQPLAPDKVDWHAVAAGRASIEVRQLPGPANSMGEMKFGFPNKYDIYLHDTPKKELFAQDDRDLSHGCIRLEDAEALGRWMLQRDPRTASDAPEQQVALPTPVPIYITYLTANADGGQLGFADDIYGKDARTAVVALR